MLPRFINESTLSIQDSYSTDSALYNIIDPTSNLFNVNEDRATTFSNIQTTLLPYMKFPPDFTPSFTPSFDQDLPLSDEPSEIRSYLTTDIMNIINLGDDNGDLTKFADRIYADPQDLSYFYDSNFDLIDLNNNYYLPLGDIRGTVLENNVTTLYAILFEVFYYTPDSDNIANLIALTLDLYGNNIGYA
jgi:hypothetical protein